MLDLGRLPSVDDATWAGKPTLVCLATSKTVCTFQKCTTSSEVRTVQRINPATRTYQRCDRYSRGCDTLAPQVAHSGVWTTLDDPVHAATLRVTQRGDFIEYLSQNDDVYIYRGICRT
jgi:transposase